MWGPPEAAALIAFTAGVLSILTPCVLALLPAYVAYLGGASLAEGIDRAAQHRIAVHALLFVLGFSAVFVAFGASASLIGQFLLRHQLLIRKVAGVTVFLLGLHTAGLFPVGLLERERRFHPRGPAGHPLHALLVGMAFAAGWTPCVGPILGSILLWAGTAATVWAGMGLLGVYSLGMAVPFLLVAAFVGRARRLIPALTRRARAFSLAAGFLMMAIGVTLYTGSFARLAGYFSYFQWFQ